MFISLYILPNQSQLQLKPAPQLEIVLSFLNTFFLLFNFEVEVYSPNSVLLFGRFHYRLLDIAF